jgi:hypothetical protein
MLPLYCCVRQCSYWVLQTQHFAALTVPYVTKIRKVLSQNHIYGNNADDTQPRPWQRHHKLAVNVRNKLPRSLEDWNGELNKPKGKKKKKKKKRKETKSTKREKKIKRVVMGLWESAAEHILQTTDTRRRSVYFSSAPDISFIIIYTAHHCIQDGNESKCSPVRGHDLRHAACHLLKLTHIPKARKQTAACHIRALKAQDDDGSAYTQS